jgi:hypothetical protein
MKDKTPRIKEPPRIIKGHVMYLGPRVQHLGLGYAALFQPKTHPELSSIHENIYPAIRACPPLGEMFIPVEQIGNVRRELSFDYAHNMKGTRGKFVTFYQAIQKWIASTAEQKQKPSGINLEHHHA